MGFLRRLLRGGQDPEHGSRGGSPADDAGAGEERPTSEDEATRDRELLRAEAERLDDDLIQRQIRFADQSWMPPRQGGERRADDEAAARD